MGSFAWLGCVAGKGAVPAARGCKFLIRGAVADQVRNFGGIGQPTWHILEARLIGLLVRNKDDLGGVLRHLLDQTCQVVDSDLFRVPDVKGLAIRPGMLEQADHALHHIPHPGEGALWHTIAIDRDRLAGKGLPDEAGHDHPVLTCLPGADGVEEMIVEAA